MVAKSDTNKRYNVLFLCARCESVKFNRVFGVNRTDFCLKPSAIFVKRCSVTQTIRGSGA